MTLRRFPSLAAMADAIIHKNLSAHSFANDGHHGTAEECLNFTRHGDERLVAEAEKLIEKLSLEIDVPAREVVCDVAGGWPSVPDFLAGHPDCMRRRALVESDVSPLAIWVIPTVSYNVMPAQMTARGTAILALVMALSRVRPIALGIVSISDANGRGEGVITAPINTMPLDIATAAYALTSPGFYRRLCYGLAKQLYDTRGHWPAEYRNAGYLDNLLRQLGGEPTRDLIIDGALSRDPLINDPVAWVREQAQRYGALA